MIIEKDFFRIYYNDDITSLLIFSNVLISLTLIIPIIKWATFNRLKKNILLFFLIIFSLRLVFSITSSFNSLIPNFGDTELFSNIISNNYFYEEQSLGVKLYYYLSYPFRIISGFNIIAFLVIQTFIYYISILILWRAYVESIPQIIENRKNSTAFVYYIILASIYPASLMYISVPLREYMLVFAISVFMLGLTRFIMKKKIILLLISVILFIMVRPHLIPALLAIIYFSKNYKKPSTYFIVIFIPSFLLYIFSLIIYPITPDKLTEIRFGWAYEHPENVYGVFHWATWWDVISSLPLLILQYLTSPLPILHNRNPLTMLAGLSDFIFITLIIFTFILCYLNKHTRDKIPACFFFFVLIITILSAVWEAYIGGAIRHRITTVIPLLPISAYFLSTIKLRYR